MEIVGCIMYKKTIIIFYVAVTLLITPLSLECNEAQLTKLQQLKDKANNDDEAKYHLAQFYLKHKQKIPAIEQHIASEKEACDYLRRAADGGHQDALVALGARYLQGDGVEQNDDKARNCFEKAKDNVLARYNLGLMYFKGQGVERSLDRASNHFNFVVQHNTEDIEGNEDKPNNALTIIKYCAQQGSKNALYQLLSFYGQEACKDKASVDTLLHYFERAVHSNAQEGTTLSDVTSASKSDALPVVQRLADDGNGRACSLLGRLFYYEAKNNNRNDHAYEQACTYLGNAASQGDGTALGDLAALHIGRCNKQSIKKAYNTLQYIEDPEEAQVLQRFFALMDHQLCKQLEQWLHENDDKEGDASYIMGLVSYNKGNYKQARDYFDGAAQKGNPLAQWLAGQSWLLSAKDNHEVTKAVRRFNAILKQDNLMIDSINRRAHAAAESSLRKLADKGNLDAQYSWAAFLGKSEKTLDEALDWLQQAEEKMREHPNDENIVQLFKTSGAYDAIEHWANQGSANACIALASIVVARAFKIYKLPDDQIAIKKKLLMLEDSGGELSDIDASKKALIIRGKNYFQQAMKCKELSKEEEKIAQEKYAVVNFVLGEISRAEQHNDEAIEYYDVASSHGHDKAELHAGILRLSSDNAKIFKRGVQALGHYVANHEEDEIPADVLLELGKICYNGASFAGHKDSIQKNYKRSCDYFTRAADKGDVEAAFNAGRMYASGVSKVPKDVSKAKKYLTFALQHGEVRVNFELGGIYYDEKEYQEARDCFTMVFTLAQDAKEVLLSHWYLGLISIQKDNNETAMDHFKQIETLQISRPLDKRITLPNFYKHMDDAAFNKLKTIALKQQDPHAGYLFGALCFAGNDKRAKEHAQQGLECLRNAADNNHYPLAQLYLGKRIFVDTATMHDAFTYFSKALFQEEYSSDTIDHVAQKGALEILHQIVSDDHAAEKSALEVLHQITSNSLYAQTCLAIHYIRSENTMEKALECITMEPAIEVSCDRPFELLHHFDLYNKFKEYDNDKARLLLGRAHIAYGLCQQSEDKKREHLEKGLEYLQPIKEQNDTLRHYLGCLNDELGGIYWLRGNNIALAEQYFKKAISYGSVTAKRNLGVLYAWSKGDEESMQKGQRLLKEAAEAGDAGAAYTLFHIYNNSYQLTRQSGYKKKTKKYLDRAVSLGYDRKELMQELQQKYRVELVDMRKIAEESSQVASNAMNQMQELNQESALLADTEKTIEKASKVAIKIENQMQELQQGSASLADVQKTAGEVFQFTSDMMNQMQAFQQGSASLADTKKTAKEASKTEIKMMRQASLAQSGFSVASFDSAAREGDKSALENLESLATAGDVNALLTLVELYFCGTEKIGCDRQKVVSYLVKAIQKGFVADKGEFKNEILERTVSIILQNLAIDALRGDNKANGLHGIVLASLKKRGIDLSSIS